MSHQEDTARIYVPKAAVATTIVAASVAAVDPHATGPQCQRLKAASRLPSMRTTVLGLPLVLLVGLCFDTYHRCAAGGVDLAHGDPLRGTCLGPAQVQRIGDDLRSDQQQQQSPPAVAATISSRNAVSLQTTGNSVPSELWPLLESIVAIIGRSVWGYFVTFIVCWNVVLTALVTMIDRYLLFLGELVRLLTAWPMNLIAVFGMAVALGGAALILRVVMVYLFPLHGRPLVQQSQTHV